MDPEVSVSVISQRLLRHRKADLIELARDAGMSLDDPTASKTVSKQIAAQLAEHLYQNGGTLARLDRFSKFYMPPLSPMKRPAAPPSSSPTGRLSRRLAAKRMSVEPPSVMGSIKDEPEPEDGDLAGLSDRGSSPPVSRHDSPAPSIGLGSAYSTPSPETPRPALGTEPVPVSTFTSPVVVSQMVDRRAEIVKARVADAWAHAGFDDALDQVRQKLSSTVTLDYLLVLVEYTSLLRHTVPLTYKIVTPEVSAVRLASYQFHGPDLFVLFTSQFWIPVFSWALVSVLVPTLVAYFCNMTIHSQKGGVRQFDPLVFNLTKAAVLAAVYGQGFRMAILGDETVRTVADSLPGGWHSVLAGSLIGTISSLYEAVLRK